MKTIGARRYQILEMYLSLVVAYGLLALVVAVPLGALAASAITAFIAGVFNFDSGGLELPPRVVVLEAAVAILIPLTAAVWPIWRGTGITVQEAVHDFGISSVAARGKVDRWVDAFLARFKSLPRPVVLSLRNTFRRKGRLLLTLMTLTVAGTVFMAVFSVRSSLYSTLDEAMDYFHYDIGVAFTQSYRASRIEQEVMRVPGVKAVETWGFASGRVLKDAQKSSEDEASKNVFVMAPPVNTKMIKPRIIEGRWLIDGDENALVVNTDVVKDRPELKIGGPAVIKVGTRRIQFTVVGIARSTLTGPFAFTPYDWFAGAIQETGRARSAQIITESTKTEDQSAVGRALEEHLKKNSLHVHHVDVIWETKDRIRAQFDIITNFLMIMAVLLAIVGALGLTGTMAINVLERTREIGVMRAIGASSLHVGQIFVVEALCIGVLSWLTGLILAAPVAALLSNRVGVLFLETPLSFTFSFLGAGIWLVLSVALSVTASLLPAWNAARLSVRDVLSYE
jgi:putative ABC transport system permease protein